MKSICKYFILMATAGLWGCEKMIEVDPPADQLVSSSLFTDSATAKAALNGMYSQLYNGDGTGTGFFSYRISILPGKSADELTAVQNTFDEFMNNSLLPVNTDVNALWADSYNLIYIANNIIKGLESTPISVSSRRQLAAECKFIRAFCHFHLVNYFGKVPLVTTSDVTVTNTLPASPAEDVYKQIIRDLTEARDELAADYHWSSGNRTRVNTWVASALLARVYLYLQQWTLAEAEASRVIDQHTLYGMEKDLDHVFLANSKEAIWQLHTNVYGFTYMASHMIPSGTGTPYESLHTSLYDAFEPGDDRKARWTGSVSISSRTYTYPSKYKSRTDNDAEYEMVMRLGEQYLIRAEARTQLEQYSDARSDLDSVRLRAGLLPATAGDQTSLLAAIEQERRVELFCEWGHRWLDLKRTGRANAVLGALKPGGWQPTDVLYPIPQSARNTNPALEQNDGYH